MSTVNSKVEARDHRSRAAELVLGTVQLGLPYGAANLAGMPNEGAAMTLIGAAISSGVRSFDTARAYGDAERRLGLALGALDSSDISVITKLDPLAGLTPACPPAEALARARDSLAASRAALRRERLDVYLLHRAWHRTAWGGAVWRELIAQKGRGGIGRLGVSVSAPEEALAALADPHVEQIQLPFNLLDRRYDQSGVIEAARRRPDVIIHVRSVLMQGLLGGATQARWPLIEGVDPPAILEELRMCATRYGRRGHVDLCIAYARSQDWIDGVVMGCETLDQISENAALFSEPLLGDGAMADIQARFSGLPREFLEIPAWPAGRIFSTGEICL